MLVWLPVSRSAGVFAIEAWSSKILLQLLDMESDKVLALYCIYEPYSHVSLKFADSMHNILDARTGKRQAP